MMDTCPTCKEYTFSSLRHTCKPSWDCWNEYCTEDDARRVFASDGKEAAEKFSANDDASSCEYSAERDVFVKPHDSDEGAKMFHVWLESVPSYSAREVPQNSIAAIDAQIAKGVKP